MSSKGKAIAVTLSDDEGSDQDFDSDQEGNEQPNYLEKYCVESMVAIYKSLDHYIYIYMCVCARACVNIYLASSQIKLADKKWNS